mmetsp:Transcript_6609/g.8967  ORF Transcript_6609/g.8967 Transcript_6609/m.8967 type:complete len:202 (-) Transcript_6609:162-767(-)
MSLGAEGFSKKAAECVVPLTLVDIPAAPCIEPPPLLPLSSSASLSLSSEEESEEDESDSEELPDFAGLFSFSFSFSFSSFLSCPPAPPPSEVAAAACLWSSSPVRVVPSFVAVPSSSSSRLTPPAPALETSRDSPPRAVAVVSVNPEVVASMGTRLTAPCAFRWATANFSNFLSTESCREAMSSSTSSSPSCSKSTLHFCR